VIITALSSDGENPPDILAGIGASAALMLSDIPWNGPISTVRVGRVNGNFIVNPTIEQMEISDFEIVVSGSDQSVVMVEGEAREISEELLVEAIEYGHSFVKILNDLQRKLVADCVVKKRELPVVEDNTALKQAVADLADAGVDEVVAIEDKMAHYEALENLIAETSEKLAETYPESARAVAELIHDQHKVVMREIILSKNRRIDGRDTKTVRPITIEPGFLARTHGSALFTRGETQALVTVTLGTKRDEQIIDDIDRDYTKSYMLHYNFPPFSVGEVRRIMGTSRREIGHGNLAERALKPIIPSADKFPYTVRIVSDILESNGSSSMASVCGGSLALMDAGAPIREHVAGIAMGLISEGDRHAILTDILGTEDHLGDMDFKVAGTAKGITAIQLDIKIEGLSLDLMREALAQAREGRLHILNIMNEALPQPRTELSPYAPKILMLQINPEKIGILIGPGGKMIKKIIADTECGIDVDDDGSVVVSGTDINKCRDAVEWVKAITFEPEIGQEYDAIVTRMMTFGAFVEYAPGREGLVHISELEWRRVENVTDVVKSGDKVRVKLIKIDDQGRYDFSIRATKPRPEGFTEPERRDRPPRRDGDHQRPFKKKRF
ncbi:MAG: polyribonucleotide nucleotidyltransferase, partial [Candidatus Neomarinimicrobiota bacterium]